MLHCTYVAIFGLLLWTSVTHWFQLQGTCPHLLLILMLCSSSSTVLLNVFHLCPPLATIHLQLAEFTVCVDLPVTVWFFWGLFLEPNEQP